MANLLQNKLLIGKDIAWLNELRQKAADSFVLPTAKSEAFKYTKLRELAQIDWVMENPVPLVFKKGHACACNKTPKLDAYEIYFFNGSFEPAMSNLPEQMSACPLAEAILLDEELPQYLGKLVPQNKPFAVLNSAYISEGVFFKLEENAKLDKPLLLHYHTQNGGQNFFYNIRNIMVLGQNSAATVVEFSDYAGEPKSCYFANFVNEIFVSENAVLNHYKMETDAFKAYHLAYTAAEVKAGGSYKKWTGLVGAQLGRDETDVRLIGENAATAVDGFYKMSGWATLDFTSDLQHLASHTQSAQLIKGVVDGNAKGVFQGRIYIDKNIKQAEGSQLHKAMLLSSEAEADAKPELKIYADDVKCSHGSAMGEIDENQLFYLTSRGIAEEDARKILIEAFLSDVLEKIADDKVKTWVINLQK